MAPTADDDLRADLDAYLDIDIPTASDDDGVETVAPAADADMANRLLYKVRRLDEEAAAIDALYDAEVARLDAWKADRLHGVQYDRARAVRSLDGFMRAWHAANPRTKTANLPNGKLTLRPVPGKVEVTDGPAFVAWAKANHREDLIRYVPEPAKAVLSDEDVVVRHTGPQITDPKTGELLQTYRFLVPVATGEVDEDGNPVVESVSAPGVAFVKPAHDRFKADPITDDQPQETT